VEVVVLECGNEHGNERNKFELLELVFLGNNFCPGYFFYELAVFSMNVHPHSCNRMMMSSIVYSEHVAFLQIHSYIQMVVFAIV